MNAKLLEAEREWKSAEVALERAERQAETSHKQLRQVDDELAAAREQIKLLKKKLEDAEKAKDQAKQYGYDVGVAETEEALRAEVSRVCRVYCLQVWNETFNLARVEASLALRRAKNVYYPPTIRAPASTAPKDDAAPNIASLVEEVLTKDPPPPSSHHKGAEQIGTSDKEKEVPKEVAPKMTKPSNEPKDSS